MRVNMMNTWRCLHCGEEQSTISLEKFLYDMFEHEKTDCLSPVMERAAAKKAAYEAAQAIYYWKENKEGV